MKTSTVNPENTRSSRTKTLQTLVKRQAIQLKQLSRQLQIERYKRKQAEAQCQREQQCYQAQENGNLAQISTTVNDRNCQHQELALNSSEAKLQSILNSANAAIVSFRVFTDGDWEYEYSSAGCEILFGYTATEMLADKYLWSSRVLPDDRETVLIPAFQAFRSEQTIALEYRFRHKDGSLRWIGATYTSRRDEAANCWVVTVLATDISSQKHTEEVLRRHERIISATPDAIALVDRNYCYQLVNRTYMTWHLKRREEILGRSMRELLGDSTFETVVKPNFDRCLQGEIVQYETWLDYRSKLRFIGVTYAPFLEADGTISGIVLSLHDLTDLKSTEDALKRSEERFRLLVNASPVGIFQTDNLGNCVFVNTRWQEMAGLSQEEAMGTGWIKALHPTDRDRVFGEWCDAIQSGREFASEYRFWTPEGRVRWLQGNAVTVLDACGNPSGYLGTVVDVTERKHLELSLQTALQTASLVESKLNDVLNTAPVAIVCYRRYSDRRFEYEYCSGACQWVYGYTPEELMNDPDLWMLRVFPEDLEAIVLPHYNGVFTEGHVAYEFRFQHKDGNWRWLSTTLVSRKEGDSWIFTAAISDISDRKRAEAERNTLLEAIEHSQACLSTIVEAVLDGLIVQDPQGKILFANPAAIELFGLSSELISTYSFGTLIVNNGFTEVEIAIATGEIKIAEMRTVEITWQDQPADLISLRDITNRKTAEAALKHSESQLRQKAEELEGTLEELTRTQMQLVQSEKMSSLGQLVAGVAHEINNPVSFIYGNVEHLHNYMNDLFDLIQRYQDCYPNPCEELQDFEEEIELDFIREDLPKLISSLHVGTERIREIVLSLRNFSRLDRARLLPANLHEGLDNTLMILNHRLKPKPDRPTIEVIREYGELPEVLCYSGELNQVFMNIISNAIDILEEETTNKTRIKNLQIRIVTEATQTWVKIRISDNGAGMPPEVKNKIFDPFFTTKPVGQGTGLGLSISYQIVVEKHEGTLECFSQRDRGTEFVISIPIRQST
jgi:two-component system, NtrC family, sensor kinase